MKRNKILYWVFTVLFAAGMIFSAIGGIQPTEETEKMMHGLLGYPIYFIQFISVAKILGSITILIPGLKTIKEWAYSGLFFDLVGALYSFVAISGTFEKGYLFMLLYIVVGALSYYFWKKTIRA